MLHAHKCLLLYLLRQGEDDLYSAPLMLMQLALCCWACIDNSISCCLLPASFFQALLAKGSIMKVLKLTEQHNKGFAAQVNTARLQTGLPCCQHTKLYMADCIQWQDAGVWQPAHVHAWHLVQAARRI